ncbi:MAG: DNA processing protein DprA [Dactylosporangium sp.]|nr:DNA-protecting protein DprA [Dactylosporangium sp.]NNJ62324.1 DNA processing protein DprA [Dactylosporangium sp.]
MTTIDDPRLARAALSWLVEPGNRWVADAIINPGPVPTANMCLQDTEGHSPLRPQVQAMHPRERLDRIRRLQDTAGEHNIRMVCPYDRPWPGWIDRLTDLPETASLGRAAPVCLWVAGTRPLSEVLATAITVTGARAATTYGTTVASELCHDLALTGRTILTGCGFGIDTAALRATLATGGGVPVAVTAGGPDRPSPAANARLLATVAERGLVLSAYPPGQPPFRQRFITTSVLLAALGRAVVVVEAGLRSTTLTSLGVSKALNQPALVVPGPVTSAMSAGCHATLRSHPGYRLVTSAADILGDLTG